MTVEITAITKEWFHFVMYFKTINFIIIIRNEKEEALTAEWDVPDACKKKKRIRVMWLDQVPRVKEVDATQIEESQTINFIDFQEKIIRNSFIKTDSRLS